MIDTVTCLHEIKRDDSTEPPTTTMPSSVDSASFVLAIKIVMNNIMYTFPGGCDQYYAKKHYTCAPICTSVL